MITNKLLNYVITTYFGGVKSRFCRAAKISPQNLNRFVKTEIRMSQLAGLLETAEITTSDALSMALIKELVPKINQEHEN